MRLKTKCIDRAEHIDIDVYFPHPLPPSKYLIERKKNLLFSRVLHYLESQKIETHKQDTTLEKNDSFLLQLHRPILKQRLYDAQFKPSTYAINKKVRQHS